MSTLFSDNFNRANGALGSDWTSLGGAGTISSNQYACPGTAGVDYYDNGTPGADAWVQVTASTRVASTNYSGVHLRLDTGVFNWYEVSFDTSSARILRVDGGVGTVLGANFSALSNGDVVRLEMRGSTLSLYYNDVLQGTRTDSTYSAAGRSGIQALGSSGRLDDFATGTLPTISSATPSGTLGTQTTATVGCTTDDSTGTLYVVVDTASLAGITASQIKAGQNASSASATASGNSAVSGSSPSVGVTGLSASTAYNYAVLQFSGGNSNILTGTFTTADPVSTLEQKRFRWRNDDGSETTATWAAAEDTNITAPLG